MQFKIHIQLNFPIKKKKILQNKYFCNCRFIFKKWLVFEAHKAYVRSTKYIRIDLMKLMKMNRDEFELKKPISAQTLTPNVNSRKFFNASSSFIILSSFS